MVGVGDFEALAEDFLTFLPFFVGHFYPLFSWYFTKYFFGLLVVQMPLEF